MPISIKKIISNFNSLTSLDGYYETELFTKFEDAFLIECGAKYTGIRIIHNSRSMASFNSNRSKMDYKLELGDIYLISYSPSKPEIRQLFLQFKLDKMDKKGNTIVEIPKKQYDLYNEHPEVEFTKSSYFTNKYILRSEQSGSNLIDNAGTMFAIMNNCGGKRIFRMMNCEWLPLSSAKQKKKSDVHTLVSGKTSTLNSNYHPSKSRMSEYYSYIASFEELLYGLKDMKVGLEIDFPTLIRNLPVSMIPPNLVEPFSKEPNITVNTDQSYNFSGCSGIPIIFINVDELE